MKVKNKKNKMIDKLSKCKTNNKRNKSKLIKANIMRNKINQSNCKLMIIKLKLQELVKMAKNKDFR